MGTETADQTNFNPNRRLCPDGACIGVVGPEGECLICKTKDPGWTPDMAAESVAPPAPLPVPEASPEEPALSDGLVTERRLCPDGSCVGILGADGACGTCGKREELRSSSIDS